MRHPFRLAVLIVLSILALSGSAPADDAGKPVIFLIQQDLLPKVLSDNFNHDLQVLLKLLTPERIAELHFFSGGQRRVLLSGPAGQLQWPVKGFTFSYATPGTDPYLTLAELITACDLRDQPVYLITTGDSIALTLCYDKGFKPENDSQFQAIRGQLQDRNLRLEVFYVRDTSEIRHGEMATTRRYYETNTPPADNRDSKKRTVATTSFVNGSPVPSYPYDDRLSYDALHMLAAPTGGKIYYNFETFAGALPK